MDFLNRCTDQMMLRFEGQVRIDIESTSTVVFFWLT